MLRDVQEQKRKGATHTFVGLLSRFGLRRRPKDRLVAEAAHGKGKAEEGFKRTNGTAFLFFWPVVGIFGGPRQGPSVQVKH